MNVSMVFLKNQIIIQCGDVFDPTIKRPFSRFGFCDYEYALRLAVYGGSQPLSSPACWV